MAEEAKISALQPQIYSDDGTGINLSGVQVAAAVSEADAAIRVSDLQAMVQYSDTTNPVKISDLQSNVAYADATNPLRVTHLSIYAFASLTEIAPIVPVFPERGKVELNPYRPYLPTELDNDPVMGRFLKEQIETLRRQHNLIQAGDTTYPWEVLTEVNDKREFTLGSMGRFYHPTYGLIIARYIQFGKIAATEWFAGPVGRPKDASLVDWVVTNDFSRSAPELACGVTMCYTLPVEGKFGWMVTQGANLVSLNAQSSDVGVQNQEYVWSGTGAIKSTGQGWVLGRLWGKRMDREIPPGTLFIDVEGLSADSRRAQLSSDLADMETQLAALSAQLASLEEVLAENSDHAAVLALQGKVSALTERLAREEGNRSNRDAALQQQINQIAGSGNSINNLRVELTNLITEVRNELGTRVDQAWARANAAYAIAAAIDPANIYTQLAALDAGLLDLNNRLIGFSVTMDSNLATPGQILIYRIDSTDPDTGINYGSFHLEDFPEPPTLLGAVLPVVAGIPPTLVYLPDGSLVYWEL